MRRLSFFSLALVLPLACDFDQLHNPGHAGSTHSGTAGAPSSGMAGGAGTSTTAAAGNGGASPTTTSATSSAGAMGSGGAMAAGAGGSGVGGGGATGGAPGSDGGPKAGAAGGGLTDAALDGPSCAGHALEFHGTIGYATFNRPVQDDFTLEAWIQPSATLAPLTGNNIWNGYGIIYADAIGTTNDFGTSIVNGKFAFGVGNPDTNVQSATAIENGRWTHVAATRSMATGEISVIINGTLDGSRTTTQKGTLSATPSITLGADTIDGHYFNGVIDEVRIWSVVRTPAEIALTMRRRLAGNEPGLVAYFRFDDAAGTTATDSSPTKGDATLTGLVPPTWVASDAPICP